MDDKTKNAIEKEYVSALEKTYKILIRTIKDGNDDIDYEPLSILEDYYKGFSLNSLEGIIICECYTFLQIIKKHGITDDNYISKQNMFYNALNNIEELTAKILSISMLPKPSRVLYVLKYYLYHHFDIEKDTTKIILDIVAEKSPTNSRMPKNNESLNEEIKLSNDIDDYRFNSTEGREKWQYCDFSIFALNEFKIFRDIIYDDNLLNEIVDEEFVLK